MLISDPVISFPAGIPSAGMQAIVLDLWRGGPEQHDQSGVLMGRPGIQVHRNDHLVLKIRPELSSRSFG
jgi:hypothetical protein